MHLFLQPTAKGPSGINELRDVCDVAAGVLHHLSNTLGMSMPHSLASSDTHLGGGYPSKGSHNDPLQQYSAAQLLPNFSSLYASNPGVSCNHVCIESFVACLPMCRASAYAQKLSLLVSKPGRAGHVNG